MHYVRTSSKPWTRALNYVPPPAGAGPWCTWEALIRHAWMATNGLLTAAADGAPTACALAFAQAAAEFATRFNRSRCCQSMVDALGKAPNGPSGHVMVGVL